MWVMVQSYIYKESMNMESHNGIGEHMALVKMLNIHLFNKNNSCILLIDTFLNCVVESIVEYPIMILSL